MTNPKLDSDTQTMFLNVQTWQSTSPVIAEDQDVGRQLHVKQVIFMWANFCNFHGEVMEFSPSAD